MIATETTRLDYIAYELYFNKYINKIYDPLALGYFKYIYYNKYSCGVTSYDYVKKIYEEANILLRKLKLIELIEI